MPSQSLHYTSGFRSARTSLHCIPCRSISLFHRHTPQHTSQALRFRTSTANLAFQKGIVFLSLRHIHPKQPTKVPPPISGARHVFICLRHMALSLSIALPGFIALRHFHSIAFKSSISLSIARQAYPLRSISQLNASISFHRHKSKWHV
jgi:hypothetical protein